MSNLALDAHGNVYADGVRTETIREPATPQDIDVAFTLVDLAVEDLAATLAHLAGRTDDLYYRRDGR